MAKKVAPIEQPHFDPRIYKLAFPLTGRDHGRLKRGFMTWAKPIAGYSSLARVHFLYNPATVSATYTMGDASVVSSLQFPNPNDTSNLKVPLYQTASWSLLFDRSYELWGQYKPNGISRHDVGRNYNNPAAVGVLADIMQMRQFTGMSAGYSNTAKGGKGGNAPRDTFVAHQGVLQLIESYVFFGDKYNLSYFGYVNEWDVTVTHWTQDMVPMRCIIDVSFTMLPPPANQSTPNTGGQNDWSGNNLPGRPRPLNPNATPAVVPGTTINSGISGR